MELNLTKSVHLYDEGERAWFNVFQFNAIDGSRTTAEVRRDQCDPGKLRQTLLLRGGDLPPLDECRDMLKSVVAGEAPELRRASGNGWRLKQNGEVAAYSSFRFVAPREGEGECLPPTDSGGVGANIKLMGTLDGWKGLIRVARYSTAMMVALCAAVAAPLLPLLKRQGFGLVFFGPSRAGKSTVQLVAASAIGYGTEEELPTFKTTEAGLLDLALMFDSHLLPLNEVGTASGRKEEIAQALFSATYSLMTGQDKQRHRTWAGHREAGNTFTTMALVSSEFSPSEWAERSGQKLDPGETARMIAVPALFDDAPSVFDMLPGNVDEAAAEAWDRNQFAILREGLPHHRGVAHREFIERMVADLDGAADAARESVDFFEARMLKAHMTPVQRDIVAKFGVLLAGGRLAIDYGILPLNKRELREAVERACHAAIAALPDDESALKKSISKLKGLVARLLDHRHEASLAGPAKGHEFCGRLR